jgi:hypothetical protein
MNQIQLFGQTLMECIDNIEKRIVKLIHDRNYHEECVWKSGQTFVIVTNLEFAVEHILRLIPEHPRIALKLVKSVEDMKGLNIYCALFSGWKSDHLQEYAFVTMKQKGYI